MPNRSFDTNTWTDPWFESLKPLQKILFIYCWTNNHCTQCGMYYISVERIASETGLSVKQVIDILPTLQPKVMYDSSLSLLWVRNFLRKQRAGDTFMKAVNRSLEKIRPNLLVTQFLKEYQDFPIQYPYGIDTVSIPDISVLYCTDKSFKEEKRIVKEKNNGVIPDWIDHEAWDAFVEMREKIKAPLTETAVKLAIGKLEKLKSEGHDPKEVLLQSAFHDWKGVYPVQGFKKDNSGKKTLICVYDNNKNCYRDCPKCEISKKMDVPA